MGDLMAFCIFLLTVVVCSILVYVISVYGTKEVTFEENLKASQILGTTNKKKAETKKKSKKVQKSETESVLKTEDPKPKKFKKKKKAEIIPEEEPIQVE